MLNSTVLYTNKPFLLLSLLYFRFTGRIHIWPLSHMFWITCHCTWQAAMFINWIWGDKTIILGGSKVFGPHKRNLRWQKNNLVLPNLNWGDQKCLRLSNFHFLVNLGLYRYNNTLLPPPLKIQHNAVTPFGPPKFLWSPNHGCRGCWFIEPGGARWRRRS